MGQAETLAKVGVFGIGLAAYWPQFPGLKERLQSYQAQVEARLAEMSAEVVSAGLVDTAPAAMSAGDLFAAAQVDLIVCYVGAYATSSQVLPVVQRGKAPVLILNLQPAPALDYPNTDTGEWLANCSACCVPEIANAFGRSRIPFNVVSGLLGPAEGHARLYFDRAWGEIADWIAAARVKRSLNSARIGFLGHTYPGMLDMYSDFTMHHAQLGVHIEVLEVDDLHQRVTAATEAEITAKLAEIRRVFEIAQPGRDRISMPVTEESLRWSAQVAVGLDRLVADFDLAGLTYYYRGLDGNPNEELAANLIVGNSLLTARGIPTAGEGDLKTCIAMLMMDRLAAGGSYTEFYLERYATANPFALSQGQKRRLSVATMVALEQPILVLDEPTFGQDQRNLSSLMTLLKALHASGVTILLITHNMELIAEYAEEVAVMHEGQVIYHGPTRDLFSRPALLQRTGLNLPPLAELGQRLGLPTLITVTDWVKWLASLSD